MLDIFFATLRQCVINGNRGARTTVRKFLASSLLFIGLTAYLQVGSAATSSPKPTPGSIESQTQWPAAKNKSDVDSVEHLIASIYDVISGPAGKPRDWDRFRALFLADGRLGVIRPDAPAKNGVPAHKSDVFLRAPEQYAERNDPYFKTNGFFEPGIANRIEEFGNLPFARGINSFQIVHAQGRYWIASILWDDERPGLTLPHKYLGPGAKSK
jgi:hypothetical protein